ncbi:MAG: HAD family hydrolase [Treponema sp.]|nr:HAD family hydrolase [Treponema sp.]
MTGKKTKTLYVSDLDGTLLRSNQKTSEYTNQVINDLVKDGMYFSYATARSYNTAHKVTEGMTAAFPLIVYNGAFVRDNANGNLLLKNFFEKDSAHELIQCLLKNNISPVVYSFVNGEEKFSYNQNTINAATKDFISTRKGDSRDRPVQNDKELFDGEIFYATCIDRPEKLKPMFENYAETFHCIYQRDIYSNEQWLEIMPKAVSKSSAIKQVKELLGCGRLVVFGDGINDVDMFKIADESYAVENAVPELIDVATGVIESNDADGVAKWLYKNART